MQWETNKVDVLVLKALPHGKNRAGSSPMYVISNPRPSFLGNFVSTVVGTSREMCVSDESFSFSVVAITLSMSHSFCDNHLRKNSVAFILHSVEYLLLIPVLLSFPSSNDKCDLRKHLKYLFFEAILKYITWLIKLPQKQALCHWAK